jgi:hypothetical protein
MDGKEFLKSKKDKQEKTIEQVLKREKQQLINASEPALRGIAEFWKQNKAVLDTIAKQTSRIAETHQAITADFSSLEIPKSALNELMLNLRSSGILDYIDDNHPGVVTTTQLRRYLDGKNVVVKDLERLLGAQEQVSSVIKRAGKLIETQKAMEIPVIHRHDPELAAAQRHQSDQDLARQHHRDMKKQHRIFAQKDVPLDKHTLQTILEWLEDFGSNNSEAVSVDFYEFNFDSTLQGRKRFEKLLDRHISDGFFKGYQKSSYAGGIRFNIIGVDKEKIKEQLSKNQANVSLVHDGIKYDENRSLILVGDRSSQMPLETVESRICVRMFNQELNVPLSWDLLYESVEGKEPTANKKNKQKMQDGMYRVNKRIKEDLPSSDDLYRWENNQIIRQF